MRYRSASAERRSDTTSSCGDALTADPSTAGLRVMTLKDSQGDCLHVAEVQDSRACRAVGGLIGHDTFISPYVGARSAPYLAAPLRIPLSGSVPRATSWARTSMSGFAPLPENT